MKKILLILGIVLLIANVLFGLIITSYELFNICVTSTVIILTSLSLIYLSSSKLKDAFKISLLFMFGFIGVIEFILGTMAPKEFKNNWYLMIIIVLLIIEFVFLLFGQLLSKKNK